MNKLKYPDTPCHPFDNCETVVNSFFQAVHNFFPLHHSFCQFCPVFVHDLSKILSTKLSTEQQSCFRLLTKCLHLLTKCFCLKKSVHNLQKTIDNAKNTLAQVLRTTCEHYENNIRTSFLRLFFSFSRGCNQFYVGRYQSYQFLSRVCACLCRLVYIW